MVVGVFGENCTGKSVIADALRAKTGAQVFSGKDYLRMAKNENIARKLFVKRLEQAVHGEESIIYVIAEKEHLALLPDGAVRVKVTAELDVICERFAKRMQGTLPPPVRAMLERKHGMFDAEPCDVHVTDDTEGAAAIERILSFCGSNA